MAGWDSEQLKAALEYAREWNTNTRICHAAQAILAAIFTRHPPQVEHSIRVTTNIQPSAVHLAEQLSLPSPLPCGHSHDLLTCSGDRLSIILPPCWLFQGCQQLSFPFFQLVPTSLTFQLVAIRRSCWRCRGLGS